ncbi:hypothetical protein ACB098_01G021900 [Castanea mollissima]
MGHGGGDWNCCYPLEVILQARCQWRSGKVEIGAGWISFARDLRCLYSVRWRLRCLDSVKGREPCVWVLQESDEKKKGEKGMYTQLTCSSNGSGMGPTKVEIFATSINKGLKTKS